MTDRVMKVVTTVFVAYSVFTAACCILYLAAEPINAWMKWDLEHGEPRAHFYTAEAYANCGAMYEEARRQGATHWTCHLPR